MQSSYVPKFGEMYNQTERYVSMNESASREVDSRSTSQQIEIEGSVLYSQEPAPDPILNKLNNIEILFF
jgi:hypothetical protein